MTVEPFTLGYLAGMIDADGHIGWRGGKYQAPLVGVTNTSPLLMGWLTETVGGSVSVQRRECPEGCSGSAGHIHRRTSVSRWQVTGERACIVLRAIRPFLVVKGDRADSVLAQYDEALTTMTRPARRQHHIAKERAAMRGWD